MKKIPRSAVFKSAQRPSAERKWTLFGVSKTASSRWSTTSAVLGTQFDLPRFPGAANSQITAAMDFLIPANLPPIPTYRIMNLEGKLLDPSRAPPDVTNEEVLTWYKNMLTGEEVDCIDWHIAETSSQHIGHNYVRSATTGQAEFLYGKCLVSAGEEGIMVGSAAALGPKDIITCQYRETGVFQQRGFTLKDFMSQLFNNRNDPGKGRNMPCHYSGKEKTGVHAVASTLGTQIPHAVGAAYALKMNAQESPTDSPAVAAVYFGEGAASEGDFHGALNFAATRQCPVIFICRNNGYAISTPTSEQYRGDGIAGRGAGYGIDTLRVDGNDIFAVYEATKEARRRALEDGCRPVLLEFMSYRVSHHSTSDDSFAYRTRGEVETWKLRDNPISRLRKRLEIEGLWDEQMEKRQGANLGKAILEELAVAEKEKKPALSAVFDDVYAELTEEQETQKKEMKRLMIKYPAEYDFLDHEGGLAGI